MRMSDWSSDVCPDRLPRESLRDRVRHPMKKRRGDPLRIGDRRCGNIQQAELDHPVKQLAPRLADDPTHHHVTKKGDIDYEAECQQIGRASCRERVCQYV